MIKILIADDSETETKLLRYMIHSESDMEVIGCAKNGKEAVEMAKRLKPDLITMDINMPVQNGFEAIQAIMMNNPTPIVVISSTVNDSGLNTAFLALDAGALSVIDKPVNIQDPNFERVRKDMIDILRVMAEIKVVTKRPKIKAALDNIISPNSKLCKRSYELVAIGSSVGGPQALKNILSKLPADFPVPIVIVQHMTPGFIEGFCKWLNQYSKLHVKCVGYNEILKSGNVYVAPDHHHFKIAHDSNNNLVAHLYKGEPVNGFHPSINVMFHSIARNFADKSIAMLLTGMGNDGSQGLLEIKQKHGHTLIQDPESCVVFGMAGVAQSLGGADTVVELDKIADYLIKITGKYSRVRNNIDIPRLRSE